MEFSGVSNSEFASELNTNLGAYEILHLLTKNENFRYMSKDL
jgi:hypothetical protein